MPTAGREALLSLSLLGRPLGDHALLAVADAGLEVHPSWAAAIATGRPVLVHDPLCPLLPASVLVSLLDRLGDRPLVGSRPVTDTVKTVSDDRLVGSTLDRTAFRSLASPVAVPAALARSVSLGSTPAASDLPDLRVLVEALAALTPGGVELVEVPPLARRVHDESDVALLDALAR